MTENRPLLPSPKGADAVYERPPPQGYQFDILKRLNIFAEKPKDVALRASQVRLVPPLLLGEVQRAVLPSNFTATVAYVKDPRSIFVLPLFLRDQYMLMQEELTEYSPQGRPSYGGDLQPVENEVGLLYEHPQWFRVWIKRIHGVQADVFLLDYGEMKLDVPWACLKPAPRHVATTPVCCVQVISTGASNGLTEQVTAVLSSIVDEEVTINVMQRADPGDSPDPALIAQILHEGKDISETLRELDHSRYPTGQDGSENAERFSPKSAEKIKEEHPKEPVGEANTPPPPQPIQPNKVVAQPKSLSSSTSSSGGIPPPRKQGRTEFKKSHSDSGSAHKVPFPLLKTTLGEKTKVKILAFNPITFEMMLVREIHVKEMKHLSESVKAHMEKLGKRAKQHLTVESMGHPILAKFGNSVSRGRVLRWSPDGNYLVELVDRMETVEVSKEDLFPLTKEMARTPIFTFKAVLHGIKDNDFTPDIKHNLLEILPKAVGSLEVVSLREGDNGIPTAEVMLTLEEDEYSVNQQIMEAGLEFGV